jgi:ABC-2 type transport system permease protein
MISYLIKAMSFFMKEIHDVRRQPRLLLSLVGGPLLVLAAFGATFRSANPFITTVLVWPEQGVPGVDREQAIQFIGANFNLIGVVSDEAQAMELLNSGQVDSIQIIPQTDLSLTEKTRPEIRVLSRTIDPQAEAWLRSLAYGEMNFINQQLLTQEASQAKEKAQEIDASLASYQTDFENLSRNLSDLDIERTSQEIDQLDLLLKELTEVLPPKSFAQANLSPELGDLYRDIELLTDDLDELDQALRQVDLATQTERLGSTIDEIKKLRLTIGVFNDVPAENIVSPVKETYTNLRGGTYSLVVFYAPAVLALLIQQLAITLASLGLVRERQMGSFEMFRVSPLSFSQIILGKSLAYILYVTFAGVILTLLMSLLGVPLPASPGQYLVMLILLATASVGIGFLISATSRTDGQAIQNTMLVLLLSIFFTGFFLPIAGFSWPAWVISLLLPMTYAIRGFQDLMLSGTAPLYVVWIGLGLVALLSYVLVAVIMRRQYRQVLD